MVTNMFPSIVKKSVVCPKCARPHKINECISQDLKCINCLDARDKGGHVDLNHASWDRNCSVHMRKLQDFKNYIIGSIYQLNKNKMETYSHKNTYTSSNYASETLKRNKNIFLLCYQNMRGLNSKIKKLFSNMSSYLRSPKLGLNPMYWIVSCCKIILFCVRNFEAMRLSRGGGALLVCNDNLVASKICIAKNEYFKLLPVIDILIVEIGKSHKYWFIILVYRV